ncbi:uncharacterized protein GLRG_06801, partial [Colletotrichum graminicola M1.001]
RRKKCVENTFPTCGSCARLNLKCVRSSTRDVVPTSWVDQKQPFKQIEPTSRTSSVPESSSSFPLCSPMPTGDHLEPHQKRQVMRYYITVLCHYLTASEQFNSFLSAFASGHLSLSNESYKVTALKAHSTAISNFTIALSTPQQHVTWYETQAATCLAFVVGEVSRGDNGGWSSHLHGAKLLIESAVVNTSNGRVLRGPDVFKSSSEGQWILRNFAYHDIIASVTLRRRPLLDCSYLDGITDVVDTYLGVATDLLRHVATLSILDEETKLGPDFAAEDISKRQALFYGDGKGGRFTATVKWDTLPAKICIQVSDILRHVSDISIGSHTESAILFPLFLAGSEATEDGHMDAVRVRLQMTLQKRQFQNIARSLAILEDLWQRRQVAGASQVDWTDILDETGEHLLLT